MAERVASRGPPRYRSLVRGLRVWDAGEETPLDGYRADQLMAARVGSDPDNALMRLWSRPLPALSVGRFHRIAEGAHPSLQRRLSGGRVVPVGPGFLGVSLAVGSTDWLAPGNLALKPEQVLNRALRPMLALLRSLGADVFYGGRDLVTCAHRPLLYASFCPFADGVVLVEQILALSASFAELAGLAAAFDPSGITAMAPTSFASAIRLADLLTVPPRRWWAEHLTDATARAFAADSDLGHGPPTELACAFAAEEQAYLAFACERGACAPAARSASAIGMLGVVEASAVVEHGSLQRLEVSGDLIAPFETLEALGTACEGKRAEADTLRRIVARELLGRGRYILGILDLEDLVARLATA